MGRFSVNISYNIGLQYAAELLPTVVRAQGVAFIHIMGYVASLVAPFVVYLANISQSLPLIVLGVLGIFGGVLSLFLPETLGQELPQNLADGEEFGKNQKMWSFPCISKYVHLVFFIFEHTLILNFSTFLENLTMMMKAKIVNLNEQSHQIHHTFVVHHYVPQLEVN